MSIELQEALKKARDKVLWCVHVLGPDELIATASHWEAEQRAAKLITALHRSGALGDDVLCLPVVRPWPYSEAAHHKALAHETLLAPSVAGEMQRP